MDYYTAYSFGKHSVAKDKIAYFFKENALKDQNSENWHYNLPSVRKSIIGTYSNSHHVFVTNRTIISLLFLTPFLDSKDGKFFYDLENDPTTKSSTGYEPKKVKFWLQELAIFGDASLIISIAASEVNLEAGD